MTTSTSTGRTSAAGAAEIIEQPPGEGPADLAAFAVPWAHPVMTMPIYPSVRSLFDGYVLPNASTITESLAIKEKAIGTNGTFSYQQCLVGCDALFAYPGPLPAIDDTNLLLVQLRGDRLQLPTLVSHLELALEGLPRIRILYAGLTVADIVERTTTGLERYFNQKPMWPDVTLLIALDSRADLASLQALPEYHSVVEAARATVLIWSVPDLAVAL